MNKKPLRLGELLVQLGRVTPEQVAEALIYQQKHGGYLGDGLIRLGAVTRDQLRWTLADQHDLPYVRLRPESIDRGLAARVPAAWAREHHILPVLLVDGEVTVVLGDITDLEKVEEVRVLTGATSVAPALSSPEDIRALIHAVYSSSPPPAFTLAEFMEEAARNGAVEVGVSVREGRATGWYRVIETVQRPLLPHSSQEMESALFPPDPAAGHLRSWPALLRMGPGWWRVEARAIGQGSATEWSARLVAPLPEGALTAEIDAELSAEIRRHLDRGPLVALVVSGEGSNDLTTAALPLLPALVLGEGVRCFHVSDRDLVPPPATLAVAVQGSVQATLAGLAPFSPQAITLDVSELGAEDAAVLRSTAPLAFLLRRDEHTRDIHIGLTLSLRVDARGVVWTLEGHEDGEN